MNTHLYTTAKIIIDGKTFKGGSIGFVGTKKDLELNERAAIKNLILNIPLFKYWKK